ncbi:porin [Delftia acidovorans]|uniref:porin n=1 Tax=Delftia acidovorans TaxID=80866 RepID=UPI001EFC5428|nr:porin [Delftia acidovorans]MCG8986758.1 porin [Delftia acidovorans]
MKTLQRGGWAVGAAALALASHVHAQTQTQAQTQAQTSAPPAIPSSSVTLYGVVDMAVESARTGNGGLQRLESGVIAGSRWGLRGTEDLGGGQRALYVVEAGFNGDTGASGQGGLAFGRQVFVGLGGGWGQLTAGRHYTTLHTSLASYALTGLIWGNAANYFRDGTVLRASNSLRYQSPNMGGFTVRGMYSFGEAAGSSVASLYGGSVDYAAGPWALGASWMQRRTTAVNTDRYALLGAAYDFGVARAALLLSTRRDGLPAATSGQGRFYEASVTVPMGMAGQWLLSYGAYRGQARAQSDARALSVRYDHSLSKRTKLYAGVGRIHNEAGAAFTINTASNAGPVVQAGSRPSSVVLGISHAF